eukprot:scaffold8920_cov84-Skeletonema_dohrnii-CCMP3373.AAC.6
MASELSFRHSINAMVIATTALKLKRRVKVSRGEREDHGLIMDDVTVAVVQYLITNYTVTVPDFMVMVSSKL